MHFSVSLHFTQGDTLHGHLLVLFGADEVSWFLTNKLLCGSFHISIDVGISFQSLSVYNNEVDPELSDGVSMGYSNNVCRQVIDDVSPDEVCYVFSHITSSSADGVGHPFSKAPDAPTS